MVPAADTDKRIWNEYSYLTKQPNCFEGQDQHMDACAIPGALASLAIVMLTNDGLLYLILEMPIVDGIVMNDSVNTVVSTRFIMENMKLGQ